MIRKNKTFGGLAGLLNKLTQQNPSTVIYAGQSPGQLDNGVTAATGSTQATGTKITKRTTVIGTCGNAGDSLTLPKATVAGFEYNVKNNGANSADIFPPLGGNCDAAGANTAIAVVPKPALNNSLLMGL